MVHRGQISKQNYPNPKKLKLGQVEFIVDWISKPISPLVGRNAPGPVNIAEHVKFTRTIRRNSAISTLIIRKACRGCENRNRTPNRMQNDQMVLKWIKPLSIP